MQIGELRGGFGEAGLYNQRVVAVWLEVLVLQEK